MTSADRHEAKKARRIERLARLRAIALPAGEYTVIYADPPWRFEVWSEKGMDRAADNHYPTMSTDEIAKLAIPAARESVLFLWATVPKLLDAYVVMAAWGFVYKSATVWDKQLTGTGYWARNRCEILLIGTRGSIPAPVPPFPGLISVRRTRHSAKPPQVRDLIEAAYPGVPRLELFARDATPGWTVWGDEIPA